MLTGQLSLHQTLSWIVCINHTLYPVCGGEIHCKSMNSRTERFTQSKPLATIKRVAFVNFVTRPREHHLYHSVTPWYQHCREQIPQYWNHQNYHICIRNCYLEYSANHSIWTRLIVGEMSMINPVVRKIIWQILCCKTSTEESNDNSIYIVNA